MTTLGVARSLEDQNLLDFLDQNLGRNSDNSRLIGLLQSIDNGLINLRDSWRLQTQENSTLIQFMKDFDSTLSQISNSTTIKIDRIPVRFQFSEGENRTRRGLSEPGEARQNIVTNLMKVVDNSLIEVRQFLTEAEQAENQHNEEDNTG